MLRLMTSRWISEVPSKIVKIFAMADISPACGSVSAGNRHRTSQVAVIHRPIEPEIFAKSVNPAAPTVTPEHWLQHETNSRQHQHPAREV
jgi:hypothetical protein